MRLSGLLWFSLVGVLAFAHSVLSGPSASLANVPSTAVAAPHRAVGSDGMSRGMKPPESLRLNLEGRDIVTIYSTGDVRLAEDLTVDEASREFWRKVGELAPTFCRERAAQAPQAE